MTRLIFTDPREAAASVATRCGRAGVYPCVVGKARMYVVATDGTVAAGIAARHAKVVVVEKRLSQTSMDEMLRAIVALARSDKAFRDTLAAKGIDTSGYK